MTQISLFIQLFLCLKLLCRWIRLMPAGSNTAFLVWEYKNLVNQATTTWGSGAKGYVNLSKLFDFIIQHFINNKTKEEIIAELDKSSEYNFIKAGVRELNPKMRKDFSSESKSEVFLKAVQTNVLRCNICRGFLHVNSIQIGHEQDIKNDGKGNADNGRLEHPYCNSIKDKLIEMGFIRENV